MDVADLVAKSDYSWSHDRFSRNLKQRTPSGKISEICMIFVWSFLTPLGSYMYLGIIIPKLIFYLNWLGKLPLYRTRKLKSSQGAIKELREDYIMCYYKTDALFQLPCSRSVLLHHTSRIFLVNYFFCLQSWSQDGSYKYFDAQVS